MGGLCSKSDAVKRYEIGLLGMGKGAESVVQNPVITDTAVVILDPVTDTSGADIAIAVSDPVTAIAVTDTTPIVLDPVPVITIIDVSSNVVPVIDADETATIVHSPKKETEPSPPNVIEEYKLSAGLLEKLNTVI
jgi:hypothetical protein